MVGTYHGRPVMWAAAPADDQVMAVWSPYGNTRRSLEMLDTAILGSAVLAATAVALAGLFLAHRISRRLSATAAVARRITAGDLDARVGDTAGPGARGGPAGQDEVGAVAAALDSVAALSRAASRPNSASPPTSPTSCAPRSPESSPRPICSRRAGPRK